MRKRGERGHDPRGRRRPRGGARTRQEPSRSGAGAAAADSSAQPAARALRPHRRGEGERCRQLLGSNSDNLPTGSKALQV